MKGKDCKLNFTKRGQSILNLAIQFLERVRFSRVTWNTIRITRKRRVVNLAMLSQDFTIDYIA